MTQTISDDFQAAKPQRSLMALLDFLTAFDGVWGEEPLLAVSSKGLPIPFVLWSSTRFGAVVVARLRTGYTPLLKAYANQLDTTVDPKCPGSGWWSQTAAILWRTVPTAVGSFHQPGQRAGAC